MNASRPHNDWDNLSSIQRIWKHFTEMISHPIGALMFIMVVGGLILAYLYHNNMLPDWLAAVL